MQAIKHKQVSAADKKQTKKSHSTNETSIYTHHLLELFKTSTAEPRLDHGKPTVVTDSIGPAINALELLVQQGGFHPFPIQLCCCFFFPSRSAVYLAPRTSSTLSPPQGATHTRSNESQHWRILFP